MTFFPKDFIKNISPTEFTRLYQEIDDVFENHYPIKSSEILKVKGNYPKINIIERKESFEIVAATPGLTKDELEINYKTGTLTIKGEAKQDEFDENDKFICRELKKSSFSRLILIDEDSVEVEKISSKYENGELRITIPKKEEIVPKNIKIDIK